MTVLEALAILESAVVECEKERHQHAGSKRKLWIFWSHKSGPSGWSLSTDTRSIGTGTAIMSRGSTAGATTYV